MNAATIVVRLPNHVTNSLPAHSSNPRERQTRVSIVREIKDFGFALDPIPVQKAPEPRIDAVFPVIAHQEVMARRNDNRSPVVARRSITRPLRRIHEKSGLPAHSRVRSVVRAFGIYVPHMRLDLLNAIPKQHLLAHPERVSCPPHDSLDHIQSLMV